MIEKGTILRVQTKTKNDVFGDVLYEVTEVGLPAPEKERRERGKKDGVRCVMLGGSGPSARKGFTVIDSEAAIKANIASGITEIVQDAKKDEILSYYKDRSSDGTPRRAGEAGCVEID